MMATIDASRLLADLTYVETMIAATPALQVMTHTVFTDGQQVKVEVQGGPREARAWRAAFNGRILPSQVDRFHVWRQLVICSQVEIQVVCVPNRGA